MLVLYAADQLRRRHFQMPLISHFMDKPVLDGMWAVALSLTSHEQTK